MMKALASALLLSSAAHLGACSSDGNSVSAVDRTVSTAAAPAIDPSPRNVIVFVADGMGVSTVTAARIFDGQQQGLDGESHSLHFESFPHLSLVKTYNADSQVPDSAGTATALFSGYKANIGTLNVLPQNAIEAMVADSCAEAPDPSRPTLLQRARSVDKSVGIVTTTRLTHATPAAIYGRAVDRGLEDDDIMPGELTAIGCKSLAQQLVDAQPDLALGGGARAFTETNLDGWPGAVIRNGSELSTAPDGPVLGLFSRSHMAYEADRSETNQPSLADMTRFAIDRLDSDPDGYVLLVEAGRVDHAHHGTNAFRALRDMQAFNAAIRAATEAASDDTLIVVTADHSHVFVMQGYPKRGNPILGLVETNRVDRETMQRREGVSTDEDGLPYTTLGYYNGPNVRSDEVLTDDHVHDPDYQQQTAIPLGSETHSGEDVPLYATGPGAESFRGVMDQDEVGRAIIAAVEGR